MTYKIEQFVKKIESPVLVKLEDSELRFENGECLAAEYISQKPVIIKNIQVENNQIIIVLVKNDEINDTSWSDKEPSYF